MPGQSSVEWIDIVVILLYLTATVYLGWIAYRGTKSGADFLLGGRNAHPIIMALSYGATFISTAAIVGFGGVAGLFGMSLLWLTVMNVGIGIFIAFTVLGEPTRRIGHHLGAHTFPELLGLRYQSKGIQLFAGGLIFLFIPLYAAAVLTGGAVFAAAQFGIEFEVALLVFAVITAAYVIPGGIKAVMYTDALQGAIMIFGMAVLVIFTFTVLGGITEANQSLTDMADMVPASLQAIGHQGWTSMPAFGWGSTTYDMWWTVVTAIILGVGIGVLAQPQLVVRFMTVRSRRELDRAVPIGAVFILLMTGVPFTVGSLSNAWFAQHGTPLHGQVIEILNEDKDRALVELMRPTPQGGWETVISATTGQPASAPLQIAERQIATDANGEVFELVSGRAPAIVYARGEPDKIIPTYITEALPRWFGVLFFMTLLSAGMSTLSSQFHTMGTSAGRDLYERLSGKPSGSQPSLLVMRLAIVLGLIVAVTISYNIREDYVIARFTAIFFGLCAASFLPAYVAGLFFRRVTRTAALASMFVGAITSLFWLAFIKAREAGAIGLVQRFTDGKTSLLADYPNWPSVDPVLVALPLSALTLILVTAVTRPPETSHLDRCFPERAKR